MKRGEAKRGEAKRGEARNTTGAEQNRYAPEVFRRCNARAPTRTHLCPASGLKGRDSEQCPRQSPAQRVAWSLAALQRCSAACLAYAAGWNGFEPRAGKPARDAVTAHDLAGLPPTTPTVALRRFFLACSRDSECTYLRRPCICTRSVRRASACAQTAVGQSDLRQLRVVTAARSVLRAVLHMPCTPAARCLGGGVAASHALRSAVTMLRRNTPRCDIVRRVATWHKMLQHNTACCNTCSTVQHVATQYDMPEYLVSPPSQSLR